jgi:hypothetical protein
MFSFVSIWVCLSLFCSSLADFKDLIRRIFVKNTADRITMDQLRLHPVCEYIHYRLL